LTYCSEKKNADQEEANSEMFDTFSEAVVLDPKEGKMGRAGKEENV